MIRSMTAFARRDREFELGSLSCELRTVNHRYLDVSTRLPEDLRAMEAPIREAVSKRLRRGKVECNVRFQATEAKQSLSINTDFARQLVDASREVDHLLYNPSAINSLDVMRWPGVLNTAELDWAGVRKELAGLLEDALDELLATREREGARLADMIAQRVAAAAEIVAQVRESMPQIVARQRDKFRQRLDELGAEVDEGRLEQEVALMLQKLDVAEEMDRLAAHLDEINSVLAKPEPAGRRLDFLMQELNREANTLGSKSVDIETTRASVDLKVLIEQMREQIQNIE